MALTRRDANNVCCADFEEEGRAILFGIRPKSLGKSSRRWHISEKEIVFNGVRGENVWCIDNRMCSKVGFEA